MQRREGRMCHETARSRFLLFSPLQPQFIICRADCLMHFYVSSKARNLSSTFRARLDSLRYGQIFYIREVKASNPHTSHTQSAGGAEKVTQNASIMERNRRVALLSAATTTTASLCCGVSINLSTLSKLKHFRCEGLHVPVLVSSEPLLSTLHSPKRYRDEAYHRRFHIRPLCSAIEVS